MDRHQVRVSPALVVAGLALLFALERVRRLRSSRRTTVTAAAYMNDIMRAITVVTGVPRQRIEDLHSSLHVRSPGVRPALQLHAAGRSR